MNWLTKILNAIFGKKMTHKVSHSVEKTPLTQVKPVRFPGDLVDQTKKSIKDGHRTEATGQGPEEGSQKREPLQVKTERQDRRPKGKSQRPIHQARQSQGQEATHERPPKPDKKQAVSKVSVGPPAPDPFYIIGKRTAWLDSLPAPDDGMDLDDVFKLYPRWNDPNVAENSDPIKLEYHLTAITGHEPEFESSYRVTFPELLQAVDFSFQDKTIIFALSDNGIHHFKERWDTSKVGNWFILGRDEAKAIKVLKDWYKENYQ